MSEGSPKTVLTIAGFDPSSGAGITADLKTISAHGLYGIACITGLTIQNTLGVQRVESVAPDLVRDTLQSLVDDLPPASVKIGMLGTGPIAKVVADFLKKSRPANVVLDPVLRSSSGKLLLDDSGLQVLREELLSLADVITPNIEEAATLTGMRVASEAAMEEACRAFRRMGVRNAVITGGHLSDPVDVFLGEEIGAAKCYRHNRVATRSTHGTGCAYSTAIACNLARGIPLVGSEPTAISLAGDYVHAALTEAYAIGKGTGPINHLCSRRSSSG
ncbi:MAG TPA: bifunctional hydroxymethylpyrimidine kinase/phosphomethylpyrimidine kinase [Terriglobales bacterium]|nr:bifunctional hydroxymethylpyrimidine kinase/phosphomethylpyrimidine kinase [Terriglobales bacterium]